MSRHQLSPFPYFSRRDVLKAMGGGCAALTSTSLLSTLLNLQLTKSVMADVPSVDGYRGLVCFFLFGGIDAGNILIPNDTTGYADYATVRGNLAIDQGTLLSITDSSGREFGLHPNLSDMKDLYDAGDLAFVANVGSLIEPTDLQQYQNKSVPLPLGLYSHNDQQRHWQTSVPQSRTQITGWAGRMADCLTDASNMNPAVSMNIALNSLNIMQTGVDVIPYIVGNSGATTLSTYGGGNTQSRILTRVTDSLLDQTYSDLLEKTHAGTRRLAIDGAIEFNNATSAVNLTTVFPTSSIGQQLQMVAKTIGARNTLGQSRQIFFVSRGGWDMHAGLITGQQNLLPEIAAAMKAFNSAMIELGVHNDVVLFSASDFGRTLTSNGQGSDHGWGNNQWVMGGGVSGGDVYGASRLGGEPAFPASLAPGNPLDTGRGRLVPRTAVDEMVTDLSLWFGVPNDSNLEMILPNIREFYSYGASTPPIGFMS